MIVVGWETRSYNVSENEDMVELCTVITSPTSFDRDDILNITFQVSCFPGSAGKKFYVTVKQ